MLTPEDRSVLLFTRSYSYLQIQCNMTSQYAPIAPHALPYGRPRCHHDSTDGIPYFMRCPQPPPMPATPGGQTYFNPIIGDISPFYLPQPTTSSPYGPSMQFAIGDAYGSQYYSSTAPYERWVANFLSKFTVYI